MNESRIEKAGIKPMLDVIEKYGSWSIVNKTWSNESWILEKVLARAVIDLGTDAFISLNVIPSYFNTSEIVVAVSWRSGNFLGVFSLGNLELGLNWTGIGFTCCVHVILV